ncbi:MAG: helix-turn-helix domain-containing protein, partial [Pyrobaculum sp.]
GRVLQRGDVYIRDDIVFMSLSTFKDVLDGKPPLFKLNRGVITATIRGDKLRERRESADMSLGALANELGVTRETVYRYERGEIEAPLKIANKLIIMFGEDIIKKIDITNIEVSKEELLSRRIDNNTYRLVESHPDAVRVEKNVFLISTDRDRYEKTKELAEALGAQFEKM